jgi:hypothetical protein
LAAVLVAAAALAVPDASFARGMGGGIGGGGGFVGGGGGFRGGIGGFRGSAVIHRPPFMRRTGPAALGRNGRAFRSTLPPPVAKPLPVHTRPAQTHIGKPFAHLARHHHGQYRRSFYGSGYVYPFTTWDDGNYAGSYIGVPYDPGAAIPVYGPAPLAEPRLDAPPPRPVPRIGMRDDGGEACRAERVTVPGDKGDREITVVRC